MPTVLRIDGYRFFFYSNERKEPPHVHVESGAGIAKLWLGDARIAYSLGFRTAELAEIRRLVTVNRTILQERWDEPFGRWNRGPRGPGHRG